MGRNATVWTFYVTNKRYHSGENGDVAKKGKPSERNCISSNSNTKYHKDQSQKQRDKTQQNSRCRLCGEKRNDQSHKKRMQQTSTERA